MLTSDSLDSLQSVRNYLCCLATEKCVSTEDSLTFLASVRAIDRRIHDILKFQNLLYDGDYDILDSSFLR